MVQKVIETLKVALGRIVVSKIEAPNLLANLVCMMWMNKETMRPNPT